MIDQRALSGDFTYNPTHYQHNKLSRFSVNINGENVSDFNSKFPDESSNAFYNTLSALGLNNCYHNLKLRNFIDGRSVFVVNTTSEQSEDTLSIEKTGNIRVTRQCDAPIVRTVSFDCSGTPLEIFL